MSARLERLKATARSAISRAAAQVGPSAPTLSLCVITAGRPEQVRRCSRRGDRIATWDRLAGIKASYDPDNLFRLNQNVPLAQA